MYNTLKWIASAVGAWSSHSVDAGQRHRLLFKTKNV